MSVRSSIERLESDAGNALIEFVAWLALVSLPLLATATSVLRAEAYFAAAQAMAREGARSASLGHSIDPAALAGGFGVPAGDFKVSSACVSLGAGCDLIRTSVSVPSMPQLPTAVALFRVQTP